MGSKKASSCTEDKSWSHCQKSYKKIVTRCHSHLESLVLTHVNSTTRDQSRDLELTPAQVRGVCGFTHHDLPYEQGQRNTHELRTKSI